MLPVFVCVFVVWPVFCLVIVLLSVLTSVLPAVFTLCSLGDSKVWWIVSHMHSVKRWPLYVVGNIFGIVIFSWMSFYVSSIDTVMCQSLKTFCHFVRYVMLVFFNWFHCWTCGSILRMIFFLCRQLLWEHVSGCQWCSPWDRRLKVCLIACKPWSWLCLKKCLNYMTEACHEHNCALTKVSM